MEYYSILFKTIESVLLYSPTTHPHQPLIFYIQLLVFVDYIDDGLCYTSSTLYVYQHQSTIYIVIAIKSIDLCNSIDEKLHNNIIESSLKTNI